MSTFSKLNSVALGLLLTAVGAVAPSCKKTDVCDSKKYDEVKSFLQQVPQAAHYLLGVVSPEDSVQLKNSYGRNIGKKLPLQGLIDSLKNSGNIQQLGDAQPAPNGLNVPGSNGPAARKTMNTTQLQEAVGDLIQDASKTCSRLTPSNQSILPQNLSPEENFGYHIKIYGVAGGDTSVGREYRPADGLILFNGGYSW